MEMYLVVWEIPHRINVEARIVKSNNKNNQFRLLETDNQVVLQLKKTNTGICFKKIKWAVLIEFCLNILTTTTGSWSFSNKLFANSSSILSCSSFCFCNSSLSFLSSSCNRVEVIKIITTKPFQPGVSSQFYDWRNISIPGASIRSL